MTPEETTALNEETARAIGLVEGRHFGDLGYADDGQPCIIPPPDFLGDPRETERVWEWLHANKFMNPIPAFREITTADTGTEAVVHVPFRRRAGRLSARGWGKDRVRQAACRAAIALAERIAADGEGEGA